MKIGNATQQFKHSIKDLDLKDDQDSPGKNMILDGENLDAGNLPGYILSHTSTQAINQQLKPNRRDMKRLVQKKRNLINQHTGEIDDYTQELENLYTSCLEWLLNRAPILSVLNDDELKKLAEGLVSQV